MVAVVVIVVALLIPQGGAYIPLNVNYTVGEKMVYTISDTATTTNFDVNKPNLSASHTATSNMSATETLEVVSFDGEFYTLNQSTSVSLGKVPLNLSVIQKINNTGYSVSFVNYGNGNVSEGVPNNGPTSNQYLAQLLSQPEVKVGSSITIPYPSPQPSNLSAVMQTTIQTTGNLTLTFMGTQDLTVPAGTYNVFRVDLTSHDVTVNLTFPQPTMTYPPSPPINSSTGIPSPLNSTFITPQPQPARLVTETLSLQMNYQMYLEYGSMRQIETIMQSTSQMQSNLSNSTSTSTNQFVLTQDILPKS